MTEPRTADPLGPRGAESGRLVVISGPSGVGKTSVARCLLRDPRWRRALTATTRAPREGEREGVDYRFLTEAAFREGLARGEFLEHAEVYGRLYGTPRAELERILGEGRPCALVLDVQGARTLREMGVQALYVFLAAPSPEELRRRLEGRDLDDGGTIRRRLERAQAEAAEATQFDLVLVNEDVEETAQRLAVATGTPFDPAPP